MNSTTNPTASRFKIAGASLVLLIAVTGYSTQGASAATLPAKCDGVKTQILSFEDQEKPLSVQYEPVNGKWSWFFATANPDEFIALEKKIVDLQVKMFTFDKANMDCFNSDQQAYANDNFKKWTQIQRSLKKQPSWIAGFSFVAIVWDSIYSK